jgi:L-fuculose-phosphate aldolase
MPINTIDTIDTINPERQALLTTALATSSSGINQGTSGNVSLRTRAGFLITPTGLSYDRLTAQDLVPMAMDGTSTGDRQPSSEWRFHLDIYAQRSEINAIVHTHSLAATSLACLERGIPPFHYMVAIAGGENIRCSPYATFGTAELSHHALTALIDRRACLLGHHGVIAIGANLTEALAIAVEVETLAKMYLGCLSVAEPHHPSSAEMAIVIAKFATYGQPQSQSQSTRLSQPSL